MMLEFLFAGGLLTVTVVSVWLSYMAVDRAFMHGVYTRENAKQLLIQQNVGAWNAFRRANPGWKPDLRGLDLQNKSLSDADFSFTDLEGANFSGADIEGADFTEVKAHGVKFVKARARRAIFDKAVMENADFKDAELGQSSFIGANFTDMDIPANVQTRAAAPPPVQSEPGELTLELEQLASFTPPQFESYVAQVFERLGYRAEMAGGPGSSGVDIVLSKETPIGRHEEIVQVKRVSSAFGAISVESLVVLEATRQQRSVQAAVFVTNGRFTELAHEFASKAPNLELVNGPKLMELARKANATQAKSDPARTNEPPVAR